MLIKKRSLILACAILTSCNGGISLTVPGKPSVDTNPIVIPNPADPSPTPTATPDPSPTPSPAPSGKSRIFVSDTFFAIQDSKTPQAWYNEVCKKEAWKAKLPGKFVALIATSDAPFANKYSVPGTIYQKLEGDETPIADSFEDLISGKNLAIVANAWQRDISNSYKDFAWTGQKDFHQASTPDYNCNDWSSNEGYGIVGKIGAAGSDALTSQFQECDILAHLYCIEVQ